jgi:ASC-1-like (ASCH) protein
MIENTAAIQKARHSGEKGPDHAEGGLLLSGGMEADRYGNSALQDEHACLTKENTVHRMRLNPAPFAMIKSGQKTVELRLLDEKRQKIRVGDIILFTDTDTGEVLTRTVADLHCFPSFEELYKTLPLLRCGYTSEDLPWAKPSDMEQYYSPEEQHKYGVVGIELVP